MPLEAVTSTVASGISEQMVLNSDWAEVESIELVNDGTGLGFGIVGGKSSGVIIKQLVPGGAADRVSFPILPSIRRLCVSSKSSVVDMCNLLDCVTFAPLNSQVLI